MRVEALLDVLKSSSEEQESILSDLCTALSLSGPEELRHVDNLEEGIVKLSELVSRNDQAAVALLAMRCLNHMWTAYPPSRAIAVKHGEIIQHLCDKLRSIGFVDMAEEALRGLLKLSEDHATDIVRGDGIVVVMAFMDFFRMNTQRVVMRVVETLSRCLDSELVKFAKSAIPKLLNVMTNGDDTLASKACASIHHIVCASACQIATTLNIVDILDRFFAVLENEQDEKVVRHVPSVLKSLIVMCESSEDIANRIVRREIGEQSPMLSRLLRRAVQYCMKKSNGDDKELMWFTVIRNVLELFDRMFEKCFQKRSSSSNPPAKRRRTMPTPPPPSSSSSSSSLHHHFSTHVLPFLLELHRLHSQGSMLGVTETLVKTVHRFVATSCPDTLKDLKYSAQLTRFVSITLWIGPSKLSILSLHILKLLLDCASSTYHAHATRYGIEEDVRVLSSLSRRHRPSRRNVATTNDVANVMIQMTKHSDSSRKMVVDQSRDIYYRHFVSKNSLSSQMSVLSELSSRRNDDENMLRDFRDMFNSNESITAYELLHSGAIRKLKHLLKIFPNKFKSYIKIKSLVMLLHSILAKQVSLENYERLDESLFTSLRVGTTFLDYACCPVRIRLCPATMTTKNNNKNETIVTTVRATTSLDRLAQIVRRQLVRNNSLARPGPMTRKRSWSMQSLCKKSDEEDEVMNRLSSISSSSSSSPRRRPRVESSESILQWFMGGGGGGSSSSRRRRQRSFSLDDKRYYREDEKEDNIGNRMERIRFHLPHSRSCNKKQPLPPLPEVISLFQVLQNCDFVVDEDVTSTTTQPQTRVFELCYTVVRDDDEEDVDDVENWSRCCDSKGSKTTTTTTTTITTKTATVSTNNKDVIDLLCMIRNTFAVPDASFVNHRIDSILSSLLDRPWIGILPVARNLPEWCDAMITTSPFLFSKSTKLKLLRLLRSGLTRCVQYLRNRFDRSDTSFENDRNKDIWDTISSIVPTVCFKMIVDRDSLIENACSALKKMSNLCSGLKSMGPPHLEVEFENEVGTGNGPTMEFFTVTSRALQKCDLNLWRSSSSSGNVYVKIPRQGLFPKPLSRLMTIEVERQEKLFRMMGRLFALALLDSHLVDLPLSEIFLVAAGFSPCVSSLYVDLRKVRKELDFSLYLYICLSIYLIHNHSLASNQPPTLTDIQLNATILRPL